MEGFVQHCSNHLESEWMFCVMCRTRKQAASALHRAQARKVSWPNKRLDAKDQPIRDTSTCTIHEAIGSMLQYLSTSTRHCKKFYNGQPCHRLNCYDKTHCSRFHQEEEKPLSHSNPLLRGSEGMSVMVDPGTYSITAGAWGTGVTQTHVVKLQSGQAANLDFVF